MGVLGEKLVFRESHVDDVPPHSSSEKRRIHNECQMFSFSDDGSCIAISVTFFALHLAKPYLESDHEIVFVRTWFKKGE